MVKTLLEQGKFTVSVQTRPVALDSVGSNHHGHPMPLIKHPGIHKLEPTVSRLEALITVARILTILRLIIMGRRRRRVNVKSRRQCQVLSPIPVYHTVYATVADNSYIKLFFLRALRKIE